jgi:CDP-diacylglycerol--inositol 3-phosphatidyltransferase
MCAGNELFFVALYLMKWAPTPIGLQSVSFVPSVFEDLTYAQAMAIVTLPVCFTKNVINVVQLWKASKILVGVDLAEREKIAKN